MKNFFGEEENVTIMEAILGGMIIVIELISQITKWIIYRKEKKLNK